MKSLVIHRKHGEWSVIADGSRIAIFTDGNLQRAMVAQAAMMAYDVGMPDEIYLDVPHRIHAEKLRKNLPETHDLFQMISLEMENL